MLASAAFIRVACASLFLSSWQFNTVSFGGLGDSITRNEYTPSSQSGLGTTYIWTGRAWGLWACQQSARLAWANVYAFEGYSGYRTDQILAAMLPVNSTVPWGASGTSFIPYGVRACKPNYCFVQAGVNDQTQGIAIATAVTNLVSIWAALSAAGISPIALSILPRSDNPTLAATTPAWNAAIQTAAISAGVPYINIYDCCAAFSGGPFITGYDYIGGIPDPLGLHPGNEGCQAIAGVISPVLSGIILLPLNPSTSPMMTSASTMLRVSNDRQIQVSSFSDFNGGMFAFTTGWGPRLETGGGPSTISVASGSLALYGQEATIVFPAPISGSFYSDRIGPAAITVVPGSRYGFAGRMSYSAGSLTDALVIGLQGGTTPGAQLWSFGTGSGDNSTIAGQNFSQIDFYQEIVIPPGITSIRPWIIVTTSPGNGGVLNLSQFGLISLPS